MAETNIETQTCLACDAEVRPNALFCYKCGSPYEQYFPTEAQEENRYKTDELNPNGDKSKNEATRTGQLTGTADLPIGKPMESLFGEPAAPIVKTAEEKKSPGQQDAGKAKKTAPRPKSRLPEKSRVEVTWEEPENSTNIWFLAVSIILVLLAAGIILAALYLR